MRVVIPVLLAALTTGAAGAANLVENRTFDDNVDGWFPFVFATIAHSSVDELGSPASGSILVSSKNPGSGGASAGTCIPVLPGKTYAFGASVRIPSNQESAAAVRGLVEVAWSSENDCSPNLGNADGTINIVDQKDVWATTQGWGTAPPGAETARLQLRGVASDGAPGLFHLFYDNAFFVEDAKCVRTPTNHCLNDARFRVTVEWETKQGATGYGRAVSLTDDSGYFWFFNDANVELVTKLIDACPTQFDRFWFFAAGLTDVETTIRVLDTETEVERVYGNPQQTPFAPVQDTDAFATCP
jgi:hypothetical protein